MKVYAVGKRFNRMPRQIGGNALSVQDQLIDQMLSKGFRIGRGYAKRKMKKAAKSVKQKARTQLTDARKMAREASIMTRRLLKGVSQKGGLVAINNSMPTLDSLATKSSKSSSSSSGSTTSDSKKPATKKGFRSLSDVFWGIVNSDVADRAVSNFGNRLGDEAVNKAFGKKGSNTGKKKRSGNGKKTSKKKKRGKKNGAYDDDVIGLAGLGY